MAVANDIDAVLSRFSVTIDDGSRPPPPLPTTGSIAGFATDSEEDSAGIAGALASVDTGQTATTDTNGGYTITGVPTGARSVPAIVTGYDTQVEQTMVSEDQTATVNFSLMKASVGAMGVFDISWNSKMKNLQFTIRILTDSDASGNLTGSDSSVAAAHVNATLTYDSSGNNKLDD